MDKPVYALSIKQPWAWLYCQPGAKDVENRNWHLKDRRFVPADLTFPARIYVHASMSKSEMKPEVISWIKNRLTPIQREKLASTLPSLHHGGIIGEITITHYTLVSKSPWFVGKYGFIRVDPVLYDKPIPCRGQLGFFKPDINLDILSSK